MPSNPLYSIILYLEKKKKAFNLNIFYNENDKF